MRDVGLGATGIYLLIGAAGMPVFAFERSGTETFLAFESGRLVLGATGGYLLGFLLPLPSWAAWPSAAGTGAWAARSGPCCWAR